MPEPVIILGLVGSIIAGPFRCPTANLSLMSFSDKVIPVSSIPGTSGILLLTVVKLLAKSKEIRRV